MLRLGVPGAAVEGPPRILAIGCHADDIEIGCAGAMLELLPARPDAEVHWVVLSAPGDRALEARAAAADVLAGAAGATVELHEFRDGFLPYVGAAVKEVFEALKPVRPHVVFTHQRDDRHQDHRLVNELTWNTFRDHVILEYEIPKYDGDLGTPNAYVPLSEDACARKLEILMRHFDTQRSKRWFDEEVFRGLMRLRGMETGGHRYAEAFYTRKLVL